MGLEPREGIAVLVAVLGCVVVRPHVTQLHVGGSWCQRGGEQGCVLPVHVAVLRGMLSVGLLSVGTLCWGCSLAAEGTGLCCG